MHKCFQVENAHLKEESARWFPKPLSWKEEDRAKRREKELALDENNEIIGYKFVNFGKMMDFIKAGDDANTAFEKASGQYGRVADAVKFIDPRKD